MVVFLGDFNYRLYGITYDEARDMVSQRSFDWLREKDQLRVEMKAGKVFQGMREGLIKFPPTYKFQKHQPGLGGMYVLLLPIFQITSDSLGKLCFFLCTISAENHLSIAIQGTIRVRRSGYLLGVIGYYTVIAVLYQ
jgi:hypothetical protein